jgi:hypothetical protein
MLEAIEQKGNRDGVPIDSRIEVGRTYRHALERLYKTERFDRTVTDAGVGALTGDIDWLLERAPGEVVVLRADSPTAPPMLLRGEYTKESPAARRRGLE